MNFFIMLIFFSLIFYSCSSSMHGEVIKSNSSKYTLEGIELPNGLPAVDFPIRNVEKVFKGERSNLIIISFRESSSSTSNFIQAFNFIKNTENLVPINTPITNNMGHRMWKPIVNVISSSTVKIKFNSCSACGDGSIYSLRVKYDYDKGKWSWSSPIRTEKLLKEVEYEY